MDGVPSRDRPIARLTVDSHNITALRAPKRHKGRSTDRCGLGTYLYLKVPYQHLSAPPSFVPLGAQSAVNSSIDRPLRHSGRRSAGRDKNREMRGSSGQLGAIAMQGWTRL